MSLDSAFKKDENYNPQAFLKECKYIEKKVVKHIYEKSGITDSINHNFSRIRIDSYDSLPIEKVLTFHNVIILIKSVANKNKNEYYYNIFFEKGSYNNKSNTEYF